MTAEVRDVATPVRALASQLDGQVVRLRSTELAYLDGGEESVTALLRESTDLSSLSDELALKGDTWAERYHLSAARANVIRGLDLKPDSVVLEVGAGCGAITRYLGETCRIVDAIEPVGSRATAARERTRDLPGVEVFVGELSDVPPTPAYDVVVIVGVLEYVGFGNPDRAPYAEFLDQAATVLKPGGSLVLAIENQLGVKYLVGAPEDHTDRAFDSLEGYPIGGRARTFSRTALSALVEGVGLEPRFLSAFPDYKMTRAVFDPERLVGEPASLQYRVPSFPSPDWGTQRLPIADEGLAWRTLVEAGLADQMPNSFLVVAGKGGPSSLWAISDAAVFYSGERFAQFAVETRVDISADPALLRRRLLRPGAARGDVWVEISDAPFVAGRDLLDAFVDTDDIVSRGYLTAWKDVLFASEGQLDAVNLDLVPHNLVVAADGTLVPIDEEWRALGSSTTDVLRRGVLALALRLVGGGNLRGSWSGCETVRDLVLQLGAVVGLRGTDWLDEAIGAEAQFQALVAPNASADPIEAGAEALRDALARSIRVPAVRLDPQDLVRAALLETEKTEHEAFIEHLQQDLDELRGAIDELRSGSAARESQFDELTQSLESQLAQEQRAHAAAQHAATTSAAELASIRATVSWRVTRPLRAGRSVIKRRPEGAVATSLGESVPAAVPANIEPVGSTEDPAVVPLPPPPQRAAVRRPSRTDVFLGDSPVKIQIQSVLYDTAREEIERSIVSLHRSAQKVISGPGLVSAVHLRYGDASPAPVLTADDVADLSARFGDALTFSYEWFGANLGFARGNNTLALASDSDFLLLVNPDIVVSPSLIETLLTTFRQPGVGVVEAKQLPFEHPKDFEASTGETAWAAGACFMVPTSLFDRLGGFDDQAFFMYCEDVDLSWRVRQAGLRVIFQPAATAVHDKRLSVSAQWKPTDAEMYYSAEAALMLAHKWSRPDVVGSILVDFDLHGLVHHKRAAAEYRRRIADGSLPDPVDPDREIGEFIDGNYANHRYIV